MEHIIITELDNGYLRLVPEAGYILYNDNAQRSYSEAVVKTANGFRAILSSTPPEPHVRTLEEAKAERIAALTAYDASPAVNSFTFGGQSMWISPDDRANYILTLQGAQRQGVEAISFLGHTLPVNDALAMLDAVNLYAMQCVGVTEGHKVAINALTTIDAVDNYDYTTGYPEKLAF